MKNVYVTHSSLYYHIKTERKDMAKDNVIIFPKQSKFNAAILILLIVFVYVIVCVYTFFSKEHIVGYEVREGSLIEENRFEAVILREEILENCEKTGYINYFTTEGERVGVGKLIYTLDESGTVLEYTQTADSNSNSLTKNEREEFRNVLDSFVKKYNRNDLSSLYQLEISMQNQTRKIANNRLLKNLENVSSLNGLVQYHYAEQAGNVAYWYDGLEAMKANEVTSELFLKTEYQTHYLSGNRLSGAGEPAYKLYGSEKWAIAFPVDDVALAQKYMDEEVMEVHFIKNGISLWGTVSLVPNNAGETVVVFSFQSGGINFAQDRFVDVEIHTEDETGLKIPVSSIVEKEFFLVPEEFVLYVEEENAYYIQIESYMENGTRTIKNTKVSPYSLKDKQYYLDDINLSVGTRLIKINSEASYTISTKANLTGVYNMNKGYADFKQITVLKQNESYAIVESNTQYGLNVYDYIVLNADVVSDDDFFYE